MNALHPHKKSRFIRSCLAGVITLTMGTGCRVSRLENMKPQDTEVKVFGDSDFATPSEAVIVTVEGQSPKTAIDRGFFPIQACHYMLQRLPRTPLSAQIGYRGGLGRILDAFGLGASSSYILLELGVTRVEQRLMGKFDTNDDGHLSEGELNALFDRNGDGKVDAADLATLTEEIKGQVEVVAEQSEHLSNLVEFLKHGSLSAGAMVIVGAIGAKGLAGARAMYMAKQLLALKVTLDTLRGTGKMIRGTRDQFADIAYAAMGRESPRIREAYQNSPRELDAQLFLDLGTYLGEKSLTGCPTAASLHKRLMDSDLEKPEALP